jgi:hypothetical protein
MQMQRQQLRAMLCGPEYRFFCSGLCRVMFLILRIGVKIFRLYIYHLQVMLLSLDDVLWKQKKLICETT